MAKPRETKCKCGHRKSNHDSLKKEGDKLGECLCSSRARGGLFPDVCLCMKFKEESD